MSKGRREEEEKKPKFKIIDKRGQASEDEARDDAPPVAKPEKPAPETEEAITREPDGELGEPTEDMGKTEMTQEEREEVQKEVEKSLEFKTTVIFILRTLSNQTMIHLGLIPNPISGLTVKNLEEARKLIDLFELIMNDTQEEFEDQILRDVQGLLADLKVNYTNQLGG